MSVNNSIYTNPAAFTALQNLNTINRNLELSQGRVSSGLRVSSALDDSASFSIAQGLRADIKAVDSMRQALTKAKVEQMARDANLIVQQHITQTAINAAVAVLEKKLNVEDKQNLINESINELKNIIKN